MNRPLVLETDRLLPGPPEVVWELITDWEHQGDWMLEASEFVVLSPHREGLGVEAEARIRIGGITTRDRIRVTAWEPNRLLEITHLGWVKGTGMLSLAPVDGSTVLRWVETLIPPIGVLGAIGLRAFAPLIKRVFVRDLRVLEGLVRARARPQKRD